MFTGENDEKAKARVEKDAVNQTVYQIGKD